MPEFFKKDFCDGVISEKRFIYIENEIKINLPKAYKKLIQLCDRGHPVKNIFDYYDQGFECTMEGYLGCFIPLNPTNYDFLHCYRFPPEFFPEGILAFGKDGGGNFVCFDYRAGKNNPDPPIVFWRHDADIGKDVSFIASNFEEFINMLYKSED